MENLIKALQIFLKYKNEKFPIHCEHDVFYVLHISKEEVSNEDEAELKNLGFFWNDSINCWNSYRYDSE